MRLDCGAGIQCFGIVCLLFAACHSVADDLPAKAEDFDPASYKGKVLYLDFWASWCVPCRDSFPLMNELRRQYGADDLAIVAVNLDGQRSNADQFLETYPARFPVLYDPEGVLANRFQLPGMPTSLLYNRQSILVHTHIGFGKGDALSLRTRVAELINRDVAAQRGGDYSATRR